MEPKVSSLSFVWGFILNVGKNSVVYYGQISTPFVWPPVNFNFLLKSFPVVFPLFMRDRGQVLIDKKVDSVPTSKQ